jgi:lipoyl(octanoyl) transferase
MPYEECLRVQRALVDLRKRDEAKDTLIFVEHPPVYTLGRRRSAPDNVIDAGDVPVVQVERGGDVTFHGPGQIVGYPVFRLMEGEQDLHLVLRRIEDALISMLAQSGLQGGRKENHTGVWCRGKKLVSVGVAVRSWITFHGFALNVTTELDYFHRINPCGLESQVMSNMRDMGARELNTDVLKQQLSRAVAHAFGRRFPDAI